MSATKIALIVLISLAAVARAVETEDGVLILTDANFDEEIAKHTHLLVEFYAPWCGHCKKLAPEYAKAATELAKLETPLYVAKVDATENKELGKRFEVKGYPSLKFFVNQQPVEYNGGRTAPEIVSWLKKKTGPATRTLESQEALTTFAQQNEVVAVFLGSNDELFNIYKNVALANEDVQFGSCATQECLDAHNATNGTVVLLKQFDEGRNDLVAPFTSSQLKEFVKNNSVRTVMKWDQKVAQHVFGNNAPGLFLYRDPNAESTPALDELLTTLAKEYKGTIQTVLTGISEGFETKLAEYIGVKQEDLPSVRIADTRKDLAKYTMEGEVNETNIRKFIADWKAGKLKQSLKSEEVPATQDGPVYVLVGKNFDEVVLDETKDVLVEFYAPWCGHCKKLAPIFDELAEKLKHNEHLIIAKMDSTANETDRVSVSGFPTLKFFKANNKTPQEYKGERDLAGFIKFLKENTHFPITEEPTSEL